MDNPMVEKIIQGGARKFLPIPSCMGTHFLAVESKVNLDVGINYYYQCDIQIYSWCSVIDITHLFLVGIIIVTCKNTHCAMSEI